MHIFLSPTVIIPFNQVLNSISEPQKGRLRCLLLLAVSRHSCPQWGAVSVHSVNSTLLKTAAPVRGPLPWVSLKMLPLASNALPSALPFGSPFWCLFEVCTKLRWMPPPRAIQRKAGFQRQCGACPPHRTWHWDFWLFPRAKRSRVRNVSNGFSHKSTTKDTHERRHPELL